MNQYRIVVQFQVEDDNCVEVLTQRVVFEGPDKNPAEILYSLAEQTAAAAVATMQNIAGELK